MVKSASVEDNFHKTPNISNDDQQFRLNKINGIKDYFTVEIREEN